MEQCLRDAAAAPMEILRLSCEAIDLHREMLDKGSVMMLSDVGTGVIFCWSALYGALSQREGEHQEHGRPGLCRGHEPRSRPTGESVLENRRAVYEAVMGRFS